METKKSVRRKLIEIIQSRGEYRGFRLRNVVFRPNALWHMDAPSRFGNTLHYPDGTIIKDEK